MRPSPGEGGHDAPVKADVLIVGAGPAGAAAALMLAAQYSVVLVERNAEPPLRIGESLIGAAGPLLRDLGVLARFEAAGHRPSLGQASSWGTSDIVWRDSFLDVRGPGWRIDRVRFETMLRESAAERGATLFAPGQVLSLVRADEGASGWVAVVRSKDSVRRLSVRFVIDATGRSASFARAAAATPLVAGDRLVCRFMRLAPQPVGDEFDGVSLVEAVADGWWYSATLPDNSRVLAFHTDADLPAARRSREADGFLSLLSETRYMAPRSPGLVDGAVTGVTARSQWLANPCGKDWCAVGDAALAFDPLSSQGLFNALYTGLRGGEAAAAALDGNVMALAAYRDRLAMVRDAYRNNLIRYHRMETRFRDHAFWRRRQSLSKGADAERLTTGAE
jgi:flavin-dependent dehydrogenase